MADNSSTSTVNGKEQENISLLLKNLTKNQAKSKSTFEFICIPPQQLEVLKSYFQQLVRQLQDNGRWAAKKFERLPEKTKNAWFEKSASLLVLGSPFNVEKSLLRLKSNAELKQQEA